MKWFVILLLLSTAVAAQGIADYPYLFFSEKEFNAYIIKGDLRSAQEITASNLIINMLPALYRPIYRIDDSYDFYRIRADSSTIVKNIRIASKLSFLDRPAIIIGTPCNNEWVRKVLKAGNCNVISAEEGFVVLVLYNNQQVLLVTGGSPEMVLAAAQWLQSENHFRYLGKVAKITRRPSTFSAMRIGNGDMLQINQPIGQVTPSVTVGNYPSKGTSVGSYLRFGDGRVVFGKGH